MNYSYFARKYYAAQFGQLACFFVYLAPAIVIVFVAILIRSHFPILFHALLFGWGWISWTFLEYIGHRFWMHAHRVNAVGKRDFANHQHHHTHPTQIRVTPSHRFLLSIGFALLIWLAVRLDGYFTLITGFFCGFTLYFFMHALLHKAWASKFVGRLQEYHIYHHCKYTNRCFGVTVTWWDQIFGTTPPAGARIPEKTRNFYFGKNHYAAKNEFL